MKSPVTIRSVLFAVALLATPGCGIVTPSTEKPGSNEGAVVHRDIELGHSGDSNRSCVCCANASKKLDLVERTYERCKDAGTEDARCAPYRVRGPWLEAKKVLDGDSFEIRMTVGRTCFGDDLQTSEYAEVVARHRELEAPVVEVERLWGQVWEGELNTHGGCCHWRRDDGSTVDGDGRVTP